MKSLQSTIKQLYRLYQAVGLATLLLGLSWLILINSTATSASAANSPYMDNAEAPPGSVSIQLSNDGPVSTSAVTNPVGTAFINAIPSSDGTEVNVFASGIGSSDGPIILNIGSPGTGGGHNRSHAMTLSGTTYIANAFGFAPGVDIEDTMNITTTVVTTSGSQVMSTGDINFQRAFLLNSVPTETIVVDGGTFEVTMPNTNTFPTDIYAVVMSTNTPPSSLSAGYILAGSTYNLSPSGSLTESIRLMTLKLRFNEPLPNNNDPHTLAIIRWNQSTQMWDDLGGNLFDDTTHLTLVTKRFGIYALATTPTWRDSFKELSLTGISILNNTQWGISDTIVLSSGATSGTVTSIPITPTNVANWGTLHFSATITLGTGLMVDVLDENDNLMLANVSDGADLSTLPANIGLKLRATLTSTMAGLTPQLHEWNVNWVPGDGQIYLPLIFKNSS